MARVHGVTTGRILIGTSWSPSLKRPIKLINLGYDGTGQQNMLNRIKRIVLEKDPSAKVYIYWSRARGNMKPDSDWDILILVKDDKITMEVV